VSPRLARLAVLCACLLAALPATPAFAAHDVTISTAPTSNFSLATFTATGDDAVFNVSDLVTALQTANVNVQTGAGGAQAGTITVAADIVSSGVRELTFTPAPGGTISLASSKVETGGHQRYAGPVTLVADTSLTGSGGFADTGIEFLSTVDGAHALTLPQPVPSPDVVFDAPVGATTPLTSLRIGFGGATVLPSSVATTGDQAYDNLVLLPGGDVTLASAGGTVVPRRVDLGSSTLTISGAGDILEAVSGSGGVTKQGPGTLTFPLNASPFTGPTTVASGAVVIRGDNSRSAVSVTGGTLSGQGTTGPVTASAGVVSPGTRPYFDFGVLTTGSLTLGGSSLLDLDLANSLNDRVDVSGAVNLTGGRLAATTDQFSKPRVGDSVTIVANDGSDPVVGAFSGLLPDDTVAVGGMRLRPNYAGGDGNDVVLTRVQSPSVTTLVSPSATTVERAQVTYRAAVSGQPGDPGTPTGRVAFMDGTRPVGVADVGRDGVATFTRKLALTPGEHLITAGYAGDGSFASSRSAPFTERVIAMPPQLNVSDAKGREGDRARRGRKRPKPRFVVFRFALSFRPTVPGTVRYATRNGTARAGKDYVAKKGKLTFKAGETRQQIAVPIVADGVRERTERFTLVLTSASGARLVRASVPATIVDDD
jgi:autotransporter-associated beta strand protein